MFGNLKGWLMSAAIAVIVAAFIVWKGTIPGVSTPSGKLDSALGSSALSVNPASLGISAGTNGCDAAKKYREIVAMYKSQSVKYDNYQNDILKARADKPTAIACVVEAADCSHSTLFASHPEEVVNYDNAQDTIEALYFIGMTANKIGHLNVIEKKYADAMPLLRGAFILGQRMYEERTRCVEYYRGTDLMTSAALSMKRMAEDKKDDARAAQLGAFVDAVSKHQKDVIRPVYEAISTIVIGHDGALAYAGDMFVVAEHSKDPMWQTEALLKLGRIRFMKEASAGDQVGAQRLLTRMSQRADLPTSVKTAAVAARDLSVEKFRMIGGGS